MALPLVPERAHEKGRTIAVGDQEQRVAVLVPGRALPGAIHEPITSGHQIDPLKQPAPAGDGSRQAGPILQVFLVLAG